MKQQLLLKRIVFLIMKKEKLKMMEKGIMRVIGTIVMFTLFLGLIFTHSEKASASGQTNYASCYDEMMYHGKYNAIFHLIANPEQVVASTTCQEPGVTCKSTATISLGTLLGTVYGTIPIKNTGVRNARAEWKVGQGGRVGMAIGVISNHYIAGSCQRTFSGSY